MWHVIRLRVKNGSHRPSIGVVRCLRRIDRRLRRDPTHADRRRLRCRAGVQRRNRFPRQEPHLLQNWHQRSDPGHERRGILQERAEPRPELPGGSHLAPGSLLSRRQYLDPARLQSPGRYRDPAPRPSHAAHLDCVGNLLPGRCLSLERHLSLELYPGTKGPSLVR